MIHNIQSCKCCDSPLTIEFIIPSQQEPEPQIYFQENQDIASNAEQMLSEMGNGPVV